MTEVKSKLMGREHLRPQIFRDLVKNVEPQKIPEIISLFVKNAIESAPLIDRRRNQLDVGEDDKDDAGLMFFKIPDDLHLLPLIEREMYKQLREIDERNGKLQISPELIAPLDPELPKILKLYYPDEEIRVETTFDHELRHYFELEQSEQGEIIAFGLGKVRMGRKRQLVFRGASMNYHVPFYKRFEQIDASLAPLYPSPKDIEEAQDLALYIKSHSFVGSSQFQEADSILNQLPTLEDSDKHEEKITRAWVDYNKHNGEWLSTLKAHEIRGPKVK